MPMPDDSAKYTRTNLFLLRVWCVDPDPTENGDTDTPGGPTWQGRVQRTVSGEGHNFTGQAALLAVLARMLDADCLDDRRPTQNPSVTLAQPAGESPFNSRFLGR